MHILVIMHVADRVHVISEPILLTKATINDSWSNRNQNLL
jgi:hypothetical protein